MTPTDTGKLDLEGIRARVEAATPGPWTVSKVRNMACEDCGDEADDYGYVPAIQIESGPVLDSHFGSVRRLVATVHEQHPDTEANAALIAFAREDIAALLTALAQAEESYEAAVTVGLELQARADAAEAQADTYREALLAAEQFLDPDTPRGKDVYGWQNTVDLVRAALAGSGSGKEREGG